MKIPCLELVLPQPYPSLHGEGSVGKAVVVHKEAQGGMVMHSKSGVRSTGSGIGVEHRLVEGDPLGGVEAGV